MVTLAHDGTKAYSNAFELVHRREADGPNAIWQADHTPLDILLVRPDGEAAKPWLTVVIDDYSRAIAGHFISFEDPSALHTSLALRQRFGAKVGRYLLAIHAGRYIFDDHRVRPALDRELQHFLVGLDLRRIRR